MGTWRTQAVLSFDLGAPVGDVAWAPYSSTLFAAATEDGRVVAYDLAASTSEPVCEQATVQQAQLTRLAFNPRLPLLLVGDDKCGFRPAPGRALRASDAVGRVAACARAGCT